MSLARITQILETVLDAVGIKVSLGAGTSLAGKFGIDQATAGGNHVEVVAQATTPATTVMQNAVLIAETATSATSTALDLRTLSPLAQIDLLVSATIEAGFSGTATLNVYGSNDGTTPDTVAYSTHTITGATGTTNIPLTLPARPYLVCTVTNNDAAKDITVTTTGYIRQ